MPEAILEFGTKTNGSYEEAERQVQPYVYIKYINTGFIEARGFVSWANEEYLPRHYTKDDLTNFYQSIKTFFEQGYSELQITYVGFEDSGDPDMVDIIIQFRILEPSDKTLFDIRKDLEYYINYGVTISVYIEKMLILTPFSISATLFVFGLILGVAFIVNKLVFYHARS